MRPIKSTLYIGRDNVLRFGLARDREPLADLSAIERVQFRIGEQLFDSAAGAAIQWAQKAPLLRYDAEHGAMVAIQIDVIELRLGSAVTLPTGVYPKCSLVTFDADHPDGIEWAGEPPLTVEVTG